MEHSTEQLEIIFEREFPNLKPSLLRFSSADELKKFFDFYFIDIRHCIAYLLNDELHSRTPDITIDLNTVLEWYDLFYTGNYIYCSDDRFTIRNSVTFKLAYQYIIEIMDGAACLVNKYATSRLNSFDYSEDRLNKVTSHLREKMEKAENEKTIQSYEFMNIYSYTVLFIAICSNRVSQGILIRDFPLYIEKYKTIMKRYQVITNVRPSTLLHIPEWPKVDSTNLPLGISNLSKLSIPMLPAPPDEPSDVGIIDERPMVLNPLGLLECVSNHSRAVTSSYTDVTKIYYIIPDARYPEIEDFLLNTR